MTELKPEDLTGLTDAILTAIADKTPMEIVGSGTMRALGRPLAVPAKLDLSGLTGLNFYEPEELVLSAKAGTRRSEIAALLAAHRQVFAFEPPDYARLLGSNEGGTLGGMVAANLSGPRRIRSGALRDHILGFSAVSGRGESFRCGGRVMKNVTGYDLPKLMAGSWGTLSALTEVTVKVMPAPETTATLLLFGLSDEAAGAAMREAMLIAARRLGCRPSPCRRVPLLRPGRDRRGGFLGNPAAARRVRQIGLLPPGGACLRQIRRTGRARSAAIRGGLGRDPRCASPRRTARADHLAPVASPTDGARAMRHIRTAAPAALGYYDWSGGLLWVSVPLSEHGSTQVVRGAIPPATGHATLIRGPQALRASVFVFEPLPDPLAKLTERVKRAFDPCGVLNPGRMYHFA